MLEDIDTLSCIASVNSFESMHGDFQCFERSDEGGVNIPLSLSVMVIMYISVNAIGYDLHRDVSIMCGII